MDFTSFGLWSRSLHHESSVDVRDDTTASDGGFDEGIKLLVTSDCKLQMSWGDSLDLEILGSVTSELQDLSGQVLKDSSAVYC